VIVTYSHTFLFVNSIFHTLVDIAFCVITYLQYRYVVRIRRVEHLRWIYPAAFANGIALIHRIVVDISIAGGVHLNIPAWWSLDLWSDVGGIASLVGCIVFLRMMLLGHVIVGDRPVDVQQAPNTWPPPPTQP